MTDYMKQKIEINRMAALERRHQKELELQNVPQTDEFQSKPKYTKGEYHCFRSAGPIKRPFDPTRALPFPFPLALSKLRMGPLRPGQKEAWDWLQLHANEHSLIVVPTGSGKSRLVALDAKIRRVTNMLFVPYVALQNEVVAMNNPEIRVASWAHIRHREYTSLVMGYDVVVAAFEHADQRLNLWLERLIHYGRLGYCFVDEADVLLHTYRAFNHFWTLAKSNSNVIIKAMTATLRADDELQLATMLGVDHLEVLRMPSHRSDIQLILQVASSPLEMCNCLWDFIAGLPHARIIIFCMTIKEAEELAEALVKFYPSETTLHHSKSTEQRAPGRIIVATSCFGHGLNIDGLSHVVVLRSCWSVEGFIQAMGRLRQPGSCTVVTTVSALQKLSHGENLHAAELAKVLLDERCDPDRCMTRLCSILDVPCNPFTSRPQRAAFRFELFLYHCQRLQSRLAEIIGSQPGCSICFILGRIDAGGHTKKDCPIAKALCNKCYKMGHNRFVIENHA